MSEKNCYMFLEAISPNLRYLCQEDELNRLCESLRRLGQQEPIRVRFGRRVFFIEDGEKRWRACKKLGRRRIRVVITNL